MDSKKKSKLTTEKALSKSVVNENAKAIEFYKTYKEISDIAEKIDIALGRKKTYTYSSNSTKNCEINHHGISLTTESYKI